MADWAHSDLYVCGKKKTVLSFLLDELIPDKYKDEELVKALRERLIKERNPIREALIKEMIDDERVELSVADNDGLVECDKRCYFRDTSAYVDSLHICLSGYNNEHIVSIRLPVSFADWPNSDELLGICKRYSVDIHTNGTSYAMEKRWILDIEDGEVVRAEVEDVDMSDFYENLYFDDGSNGDKENG